MLVMEVEATSSRRVPAGISGLEAPEAPRSFSAGSWTRSAYRTSPAPLNGLPLHTTAKARHRPSTAWGQKRHREGRHRQPARPCGRAGCTGPAERPVHGPGHRHARRTGLTDLPRGDHGSSGNPIDPRRPRPDPDPSPRGLVRPSPRGSRSGGSAGAPGMNQN